MQSGVRRLLPNYGTPGPYGALLFDGKVNWKASSPTRSHQKLFSPQQPNNQKVHSYSGHILSLNSRIITIAIELLLMQV